MATHLVCPDVSEYQDPLDDSYERDFVIFRVTFGAYYLDPNFLASANAAKRLHDEGRLAGVLLYTVYTAAPLAEQFEATWRAIGPDIPPWLAGIMIDVESWRGRSYALSGDHSRRINKLFGMHAHRLRSYRSVIAYGNAGDLHELYPGRDRRCRVIVADYGPALRYHRVHGAIGQQYTDGGSNYDVPRLGGRHLPKTSRPFGHCDHNVFPGCENGHDLRRLLRPQAPRRSARRPVAVPAPTSAPKHAVAATARHPTNHPAPVDALVSADGSRRLVLHNDGTLEMRANNVHVAQIALGG